MASSNSIHFSSRTNSRWRWRPTTWPVFLFSIIFLVLMGSIAVVAQTEVTMPPPTIRIGPGIAECHSGCACYLRFMFCYDRANIRAIPPAIRASTDLIDVSGMTFNSPHITAYNFTDGYRDVRTLILQHNNIESISGDAFNGLTRLESLDLDNNRVSTLASPLNSLFQRLKFVSLFGNPWMCDNHLVWLFSLYRQRTFIHYGIGCIDAGCSETTQIRCSAPSALLEKEFRAFTFDDYVTMLGTGSNSHGGFPLGA